MTPAGYSGTPLPKKLGIKEGYRVALVGAPSDFDATLGELPDDVTLTTRATASCDLIVWFVKTRADLERRAQRLADVAGAGGLWIAWPKKTSALAKPDLTKDAVREVGLATGLVDVKVAAVDDDWSGHRFVRRKA